MKRLSLLPLIALSCAALACNMLASRFQQTPMPVTATPRTGVVPAPTSAPAPGEAPLKIEGGPTIGSPRETRVAIDEGAPVLEQLAPESYDQAALEKVGETFTFTIDLTDTDKVLWVYGWCATRAELVTSNLEDMQIDFQANGVRVDLAQFQTVESQSGDLPCFTYVAVVYDFPKGETTLETRVTFKATVNDGLSDYPPGTQTFEYTVTAP